MTTYCQDCTHVYEKKGPTWNWLCRKFPRMGGEGFVTRGYWDDDPPFMRCKDINRYGACPLWESEDASSGDTAVR